MSDIEELEPERRQHPQAPPPAPRPRRTGLAFALAAVADVLQWILWPLFMAGFASPVTDVLDVVVGVVMIRLLGWHWAFLPTFVAELLPGIDLVPTWTLAVWLATRGNRS